MSDSQQLDSRELTLRQLPRHVKLPSPVLAHVTSPSPAKARRRPAAERPSLAVASVAPVKLPPELFVIATSRISQGDVALSRALDGIQAAATRIETERAKLVLQSQELQIWDMAREEELVLLRAEKEQLEQQLAAVAEKVGKGQGRDGVLESLQFALRKARKERDAEMREADSLFNQLQEAKAAAMELGELRAAFSTAISALDDGWSTVPLLAEEALELRTRASAAVQDPTKLGHKDMATVLSGLLALAARGAELQREAQALRGEKTMLQQELDAARQKLTEQARQPRPGTSGGFAGELRRSARSSEPGSGYVHGPGQSLGHASGIQQHQQQLRVLQQQVSELQAKLAEYRAYVEDNQEEIEGLQNEIKRLRQVAGEGDREADAQTKSTHLREAPRHSPRHVPSNAGSSVARARGPPAAGSSKSCVGAASQSADPAPAWGRGKEHAPHRPLHSAQQPQQVVGTPTRHMPSSSSPISTVNYGASSPREVGSPARGSPISQRAAADIAFKVVELQELARRAQQQAVAREGEILRQHEAHLEALQRQLLEQKDAEIAELEAQVEARHAAALAAREADLARKHARIVSELEAQASKAAIQHAQAIAELHAHMAMLGGQHAAAMAERESQIAAQHAQQLREREEELSRMHAQTVAKLAAQVEARVEDELAEQAAELARQHAADLRQAKERLEERHAQRVQELEEQLTRRFAEEQAWRDAEARRKHAERLAEQAVQLTRLHAEHEASIRMQYTEAMADREAQLQGKFERQMAEREGQLADTHAEQLRKALARSTAAADEAQRSYADRLADALHNQHEALASQAEARLQRERAELSRLAQAHELDDSARQLEEDARRREGELAAQLDAQRERMEELERQVLRVQIIVGGEPSSSGPLHGAAASCMHVAAATGGEPEVSGRQDGTVTSNNPLRQSEVLQRYADKLETVLCEAERMRQEAVAEVERQYVDVMARLGREHEETVAETRTAHGLCESNLGLALERQAQEARDAERRHAEQLQSLQGQLAELRDLLTEERARHDSSNTALQEQAAQLATELDATRWREAEAKRKLASRQAELQGPLKAGEQQASKRSQGDRARDTPLGRPLAEHAAHIESSTAKPARTAEGAWPDGQTLLWPDDVPESASGSAPDSLDGTVVAEAAAASPPPQQHHLAGNETVRRSDQDLALNVVRVLRMLETMDGGGQGARKWDSSNELDPRPGPRQELMSEHRGGTDARVAPAQRRHTESPGAAYAARKQPQRMPGRATIGTTVSRPSAGRDAATGAASGGEVTRLAGGLVMEEWGELVGAPPPSPAAAVQQTAGPAAASGASASAASMVGGLGYTSEAAASVSTDSGYNSETEFHVDDEDDDQRRGRALTAALAQPLRAASAELPVNLLLALEELQRRQRAQSAAAVVSESRGCGDRAEAAQAMARPVQGSAAPVHGEAYGGGVGIAAGAHEIGELGGMVQLLANRTGAFPSIDARLLGPMLNPAQSVPLRPLLLLLQQHRQRAQSVPAAWSASSGGPALGLESDLEATLSGSFPVPPPLQPSARDRPSPLSPLDAADTAHVASRNGSGGRTSHGGGSPAAPAHFTFSEPQRTGPAWDGTPIGGCSPLAEVPGVEGGDISNHHGDSTGRGVNSDDRFDFAPGGQACGHFSEQGLVAGPPAAAASPRRASTVAMVQVATASPSRASNEAAGVVTLPSPGAAREAVPVTPLVLPNPLSDQGGEVSPPWSAADWNTGASPLERGPVDGGASLLSTPGSENHEGGSGISESVDDNRNRNAANAERRISNVPGALNASYNQPYGSLPPEWKRSRLGRDSTLSQAGEAAGGSGIRTGSSGYPQSAQESADEDIREEGPDATQRRGAEDDVDSSEGRGEDSPDDDVRSLLAAGATLSSTEQRRRQRQRMADAQVGPPVGHPIDLLRQGWEFVGGVASPISPQSSPRHSSLDQSSAVALASDSPRGRKQQQRRAASPGPPTEELQRQQEEQQLQELLPLQARSSPPGALPTSASSPLPRGPLGPRAASPGASASRAAGSPLVPASQGSQAMVRGSPSGLALGPFEARQRSRTVMVRARSRVAELEGQCRALAASYHPDAADAAATADEARVAAARDGAVATAAQSLPSTPYRRSRLGDCSKLGLSVALAKPAATGGDHCRRGSHAIVQASPSALAAPAQVADALDDLRGDLSELEALHQLTVRAAVSGPNGSLMVSPEPDPSMLLLAGHGLDVAAADLGRGAAAATAESAESTHPGSPRQVGTSPEADAREPRAQAAQPPRSPRTSAGVNAPVASAPPFGAAPGRPSTSVPNAGPAGTVVVPAEAAADPRASSPAVAQMAAVMQRHSAVGTPPQMVLAAPAQLGLGTGSIDPAVLTLLQLSIQAQLQGHLQQLEGKVAELQHQNHSMFVAASTPATPLPQLPHSTFRHSGAISVAPMSFATPFSTMGGRHSASGSSAGAAVGGQWGDAVGLTPSGDSVAMAAPWGTGHVEGRSRVMSHGGSGTAAAWPALGAGWESTLSTAAAAGAGLHGHAPVGAFHTPAPAAAAPAAAMPAQNGLWAAADVMAGAYSPEELSQLPPILQLFAPPQLRAAALASQGNRRAS